MLEDIYRGYRIKVAADQSWTARVTEITTGRDAPIHVSAPLDQRAEHCRDLARREVDRYIAFLATRC